MTKLGNARLVLLPGGQPTLADDATLFQQWMDGEPNAARMMWQRFAPMVHRILKRSLGRDASLEDIEQEVFLCLFQRAQDLREPKALRAFILSITTRTLHREFRRRGLGRRDQLQFTTAERHRLVVHPDLESREGLRQFCGILERVNCQDRAAFVLRFIEGLEVEDVAAALDVSLATAKRRLSRARERVALLARRNEALVDYLPGIDKDGACA
ncbi:MAG TPA: sigma-70 family RNA polymerase sigma factor [Polyangiaceae bacterium]|nr:sigma-70 family RNA polymerase sigma factor [Polyangiaceae bacterium]